jgi:hypothetical protein
VPVAVPVAVPAASSHADRRGRVRPPYQIAGVTEGERMTSQEPERLGRLDDAEEASEPSSTTEGAAARGEFDPAEGSPAGTHPTGEDYPQEATRYDDPQHRRPTNTD